ncbi:MAG: TldD/PmbA family protein [Lachnospiraceae bacterium]|nr:TldD/PmbA family protein [Lachnospiraceae bacterium]
MSEIREFADLFDAILKEKNAEKYSYTLVKSEKQELNAESGEFKLMRTVFSNYTSLKLFHGTRMGNVSGTDLSEEGLRKLADDGIVAAESAEEDPCNDFGPDQGKDVFRQGVWEPDIDRFLERVKELLTTIKTDYPKINVMMAIASFDRHNWISRNTNGTEFEAFTGSYGLALEISASDGEKNTGISGTGFDFKDLDTPLIDCCNVRDTLEKTQNSLNPQTLTDKFEGPVIMTPGCSAQFLSMLAGNYMGSGVIMEGTSLWLDKVGEQVCSPQLTVSLNSYDERIIVGERGTQDGYRTEDVTLIDKGVLKAHMLSLYAANKTGRPMLPNTSSNLVVEPGDKSLSELIASVDKGLLMGDFSGGHPGTNGEFSGVAKNSFLIENGKVGPAVMETMVNGNLGEIFKNIRGISKELLCDGGMVMPYIAFDGIVISGK